ncbi:AlpA family phage regulatory protein [Rhizobium leguminosarum]
MPDETGLSIRSVWEQVAQGTLPAPVQIGPRAVGWLADELEVWREQKRSERNKRFATDGRKDVLREVDAQPKRPRGRPCKVPAATELADTKTDA